MHPEVAAGFVVVELVQESVGGVAEESHSFDGRGLLAARSAGTGR